MSSSIVQRVLDFYSMYTLVRDEEELKVRRQQLLPYVLKALDNPNYGYLIKTGGKVQDDVIMIKNANPPTIIDCMSGEEEGNGWRITAAWKVIKGKLPNPAWKWGSPADYAVPSLPIVVPVPQPGPTNPSPSIPSDLSIHEKLDYIIGRLDRVFK